MGMKFSPGFFHIYNRGINKQKIFFTKANYHFFLEKMRTEICPYCEVLSWCLMPNHFHILVHLSELNENHRKAMELFKGTQAQLLSRKIGTLLSSYAHAINKQEKRTGSLFQAKTKAKELDSQWDNYYAFNCFHYIHQNPLRAGIAFDLRDWEFSSFRDFMETRSHGLVNKLRACELLEIPRKPKQFYRQSIKVMPENNPLITSQV